MELLETPFRIFIYLAYPQECFFVVGIDSELLHEKEAHTFYIESSWKSAMVREYASSEIIPSP